MSKAKTQAFFLNLLKESKHAYGYNTAVLDYGPIFKRLNLHKTHNTEGKTKIIDLYPTIGAWSYHLNKEVKAQKHLLMEPHIGFQSDLQKVIDFDAGNKSWILKDDDPFLWESFTKYVGEGKDIDPLVLDKTHLHPELILTANLAYPRGEVLLMQWLRCILDSNWVHRFGNVRMLIWAYQHTAAKLVPRPTERNRAKSAALAELACDIDIVACTEPKHYIYSDEYAAEHSHELIKPLMTGRTLKADDLCLLDIRPRKVPIENVDEWDYVTKQLFIVSASPLSTALNNLGPGAPDFYKDKISAELWNKTPTAVTKDEFILLTDIFMKWAFKPDIYEEMMIPSEE